MLLSDPRAGTSPAIASPVRLALRSVLAGCALAAAPAVSGAQSQPAPGPQSARLRFDIAAGNLGQALDAAAARANVRLAYDRALVEGKSTAGLRGEYSIDEAFTALLAGTGVEAIAGDGNVYSLRDSAAKLSAIRVVEEVDLDNVGFKADIQEGATKMPLSIRETPQAITVVTRESIDDRLARDLTSALELTASVSIAGGSTTGGPFAGRGLATGESFVIRGQELNDFRDIRIDGFAVPTRSFDLAAFERVEVIKGPSAALYGQGSLGGFINIVRKKPLAEFGGSAVAQVGSWNNYRAEVDVTGSLKDSITGRVTAVYDDGDSFINGVATRVAVIAPSVQFEIGEATTATIDVLYQDEQFVPSHGIPLRPEGHTLLIPEIPRTRFVGLPAQKDSSAENLLGTLTVEHEFSDRWLATLVLQDSSQDFHRYFDSYAHGGLAPDGESNLYADTALIERDAWAGELRLDGRFAAFGREHSLLVGIEKNEREDHTAFGYMYIGRTNIYEGDFASVGTIPGGAAALPFNYDFGTRSRNQAVYAQVALSVAERTKLLLGARYDEAKQEALAYPGGIIGDRKTDREPTFRVGLTHDFTANISGYASFAQSFNPISDVGRDGNILDPETGRGYEIGLKSDWFDDRLGATLAVFRQDLVNTPIPDPVDIDFSINGGKQRTDGVELEVSGSPATGLTLGFAASWLDAEYVDRADPYYGMKPYASAEEQYSLFAKYEFSGGALQGLGFGITAISIGDRFLGYPGMSQWVDGTVDDYALLDGYERVDVNLYYDGFERWKLSLQVRNVLDERYIEHFRDIESNNYFGAPTAVIVRAGYEF